MGRNLREARRAVRPHPGLVLVKESGKEGRLSGRVLEGSAVLRKFDKDSGSP